MVGNATLKIKQILNLAEVYNTKIPVDNWFRDGNSNFGFIDISGEKFKIIIEELNYSFNSKTFNFLNVAFSKIVNGIETQNLTASSKNPSKILGAIFNAIADKLANIDSSNIDAIVFVARDNVNKRMSIYNRMSSNLLNPFNNVLQDVKIPNGGRMTILLNSKLSTDETNNFINHLKTLEKI